MNELLRLDIQKFALTYISTHSSYYQGSGSNTPAEVGDCRPYFNFYYDQNEQGQTIYTMNVYAQVNVRNQIIIPNQVYSYNITCNIAGENFSRAGYYNSGNGGLIHLFSVSKVVNSNANGTGVTIAYSIYGDTSSGSFPARGSSTYYFTPPTVALGGTLNTISDFNIGEDIIVSTNINNPNFTHTLNVKIGDVVLATRNIIEASTTITFNEEELNNIYNAMSLNTATFTFELITKNGGTQIGVASTRTATGTLTDVKPIVDSFEASINNPVSAANNIIKGVSNVSFTISINAKKNATISKVSINGVNATIVNKGNGIYNANLTIEKATTDTFNLEVVDSRGNKATDNTQKTFGFKDYIPLSVGANFERESSTSGKISVSYSGNYWSDNFGGENNTLSVSWKYREKGKTQWLDGTNLTPNIDAQNMKYSQVNILNDVFGKNDDFFDYQKDWEFLIICSDKITKDIQAQYVVVKGIGILELYETTALVNGNLDVKGNIVVEDIECKNICTKSHILNGYLNNNALTFVAQNGRKTLWEVCEPNTTYTISRKVGARFTVASSSVVPSASTTFTKAINDNTVSAITITTGANDKYLAVWYYDSTDTLTEQEILNSIQIEKGSVATEYTEFKKYGYNSVESMGSIVVDDISCKNLLLNVNKVGSYTESGLTITTNEDKTITINGTATANVFITINPNVKYDTKKTYTLSGCPSGGDYNNKYSLYSDIGEQKVRDIGEGITFTPQATTGAVYIVIRRGQILSSLIFQPQLEKGSVATEYTEYKEFGTNEVVLYDNANGEAGNITLSESAGNFKYLEIYYSKQEQIYGIICGSARVYSPNGKSVSLHIGYAATNTITQLLTKVVSINNTTITANKETYLNFTQGSTVVSEVGTSTDCKINRVVGYR